MCLTTWPLTPACGRAWPSATSTPATAPSCRSSSTQPPWPTWAWYRLRSCCPIGCCATGVPLPTVATLRRGPGRPPSAGSSVRPPGRATLIRAAGWSWTWRSVRTRKSGPGVTCATSGTNWEFTSFGLTRKLNWNFCYIMFTSFQSLRIFSIYHRLEKASDLLPLYIRNLL